MKYSLKSVLQIQWWLHTLATGCFFIFITLFLLFAMEDFYHESQLLDFAKVVATSNESIVLPEHISRYSSQQLPRSIENRVNQLPLMKAVEYVDKDGHNNHLVKVNYSQVNDWFVLEFHSSKTKSIFKNLEKLLMMTTPWIVIFLILASLLARQFINKIQLHFSKLIKSIKNNESPTLLEGYAKKQQIKELAELSQLFAEVWLQKLDLVAREKEILAYLSHELRTPIQTSMATMELLAHKIASEATDQDTVNSLNRRLMRSMKRMTRVSDTILYLMETEQTLAMYPVDVAEIIEHLVDEFEPILALKNQQVIVGCNQDLQGSNRLVLHGTASGIETLLSILYSNAIQHSDGQAIHIECGKDKLTIINNVAPKYQKDEAKKHENVENITHFGLGLIIAQRLAMKLKLQLTCQFDHHQARVCLSSK